MDRFQILSLTGGGYRGLYTATVLEHLENHFQRKIGECFDLICGTSIGGIIATAIAFGVPTTQIKENLLIYGQNIFSCSTRGLFAPKYGSKNLEEAIHKILPNDPKIKQALHPYMTTAVNLHFGTPRIFKTPHLPEYVVDGDLSAVRTALATSAAPLFFPPVQVETDFYVDGGLFANAPDLIGLHEATHFLRVPPRNVHILSIGTTSKLSGLGHKNKRRWGLIDWAWPDQKIVELTFTAQQQFAINMMTHNLQDRFVRIDESHNGDESFNGAMDDASDSAVSNMITFANRSFMRVSGQSNTAEFFRHVPNRSGLVYNFLERTSDGNM